MQEKVAVRPYPPVRQRQRHNLQISQRERAVDDMRLGEKIALRNRLAGEGVLEDPPQVLHRLFPGINRQRRSAPQIAKPPAIVQSHNVIGMGMGEDHRVEPADVFAQHLDAELRRGINHQLDVRRVHIKRRAGAVVFGIGQELRRILLSNHRHALRRPGA